MSSDDTQTAVALARVEEQIASMRREFSGYAQNVEDAFDRGTKRMDDLEGKIEKHETAKWKQWVAIVLVGAGAGSLPPWLAKFLG